jgi:hypothetical protein
LTVAKFLKLLPVLHGKCKKNSSENGVHESTKKRGFEALRQLGLGLLVDTNKIMN